MKTTQVIKSKESSEYSHITLADFFLCFFKVKCLNMFTLNFDVSRFDF